MKKYVLYCLALCACPCFTWAQQTIRVGAKHFNEAYILGEMVSLILEDGGYTVERNFGLGGTAISFEALKNGGIDVYPEYTGTIAAEILKGDLTLSLAQIKKQMKARFGMTVSAPYGFNNTYALLLKPELMEQLNVHKISDLARYPNLRVALSYEFMKRADGWGKLKTYYNLPQSATGMEHGLAYQAVLEGKIDVTDAYATDGEIDHFDLSLLKDDKHYFPEYNAVSLYRTDLPLKAQELLKKLAGAMSDAEMQRLNAQALYASENHREIARRFLVDNELIEDTGKQGPSLSRQILAQAGAHLKLTLLSLLAAILIALPVGIVIYKVGVLSKPLLYITGMLQTIPSIALLALMIPFFGIGVLPAVIALFMYALLPILRNTIIGLTTVDPQLKKVATGMGLTAWQALRHVELPLAMPAILTGIRTAAVINIGTATLAAFIGAGGLGEFIVTGLALNNTNMILQGAIPAAILAILVELVFEGIEWVWVPAHLRKRG